MRNPKAPPKGKDEIEFVSCARPMELEFFCKLLKHQM